MSSTLRFNHALYVAALAMGFLGTPAGAQRPAERVCLAQEERTEFRSALGTEPGLHTRHGQRPRRLSAVVEHGRGHAPAAFHH